LTFPPSFSSISRTLWQSARYTQAHGAKLYNWRVSHSGEDPVADLARVNHAFRLVADLYRLPDVGWDCSEQKAGFKV
jgi:hypothetical protein